MKADQTVCASLPRGNIPGFNFPGRAFLLTAAVIIQAWLLAAPAFGEIYQWQDGNGNIVYGDSPPPKVKATEKHVKLNKTVRPETREPQPAKKQTSKEPRLRDTGDISVILYMTDWCPYCKKTREYLNSKGIRFTEYNIDKNGSKREEMRKKSGTNGVPVLDIEGIIIRGFNPNGISAAIENKRKEGNGQ